MLKERMQSSKHSISVWFENYWESWKEEGWHGNL